ncbi:D-3-phosphoglycerate dehydrogenase [Thraustotheca clavata]|uniref:D-3-phosphoglycerate dehydrogenase n=1 Tax=Thraustotheca clavata TaxID=74557 RepID=A0A1V9Z0L7_9STRA|nr:D-3-phosphoglycerate dehydrogenase [Thraustotheca clavata]
MLLNLRSLRVLRGHRALSTLLVQSHKSSNAFIRAPKHVLCLDVTDSVCIDEFLQQGLNVDEISSSNLIDALSTDGVDLSKYDALLMDRQTRLPLSELLQYATKLKLIGVPGSQTSHVDIVAATSKGVMVQHIGTDLGGKSAVEAEMVMSLLLQVVRKIPLAVADTRLSDRDTDNSRFTGEELQGKAIGIVGLNATGQRVGQLATAMGMKVLAYDPTVSEEAAAISGISKCSTLKELYETSDVLSFHVPLTTMTRNMFNAKALSQCKKGVRLVSVGGFGVFDGETIAAGLASETIGGVALEIPTEMETSDAWKSVLEHPSTISVPHNANAASDESARMYKMIAENMCAALEEREFPGVVNGVFMPLTLVPEMKPFLALSESLGKFLMELLPEKSRKDLRGVTISTRGGKDINITTPKARSALQSALMKGILSVSHPDSTYSYLNASLVAMGQGIDVRMSDLENDNGLRLKNAVHVELELRGGNRVVVMGSVFGEEPRIVQIENYTEFPAFKPQGTLLFFNNEDRPGAISHVLEKLAEAKINIASMGLARQDDQPLALGILSLDSEPAQEVLERIQNLDGITNLRLARLGNQE